MREIYLKACGKINLSLDVTGVRQDGYHDLSTVMHSISLYDRIHIVWEPNEEGGMQIRICTNRPYLPVDERNLAWRAAQLMNERYGSQAGIEGGVLKISVKKSIPVAAGLAGGSADGAAVLIGLNRIWKLGLNTRQLCRLGEELGSDVPFCILTQNTRYRAALATGRGEHLQPLRKMMKKHIVLAKPPFGVSTKEVFRHIDAYEIPMHPDHRALIHGLAAGDDEEVYRNMINVLELYTLEHYEAVKKLKDTVRSRTSAEKVLMSGSGPTVFGVYSSMKEAKKACSILRDLRYEAYWASTDGR